MEDRIDAWMWWEHISVRARVYEVPFREPGSRRHVHSVREEEVCRM